MPHPYALFSLVPVSGNPGAERVVAHPCNSHLVSMSRAGTPVLDIGFHIRSKSCKTLATLGRGETDIFVEGSGIAKVQCSFEINLDANVVMLYDRSHGQTTQVFGKNVTPFEHGRIRKVVIQKEAGITIGMGGQGRNLIQFRLLWHSHAAHMIDKFKNKEDVLCDYEENPRLARTVDDKETVLPSRWETRVHTSGRVQLKMRYALGAKLGSGTYGTVHKAINLDSGDLMAVKILERPTRVSEQKDWKTSWHYALKREVETISKIKHPHIIDYIASQGWGEPKVEIFMGLKEGTLKSLIEYGKYPSVANPVCHQMLQALDCLACNGIVHRDVKPENILHVGQDHFQLGDFGLCNRVVDATTFAGSRLYMAPEMFRGGFQTSKLDIWSLFVTILWTLDVGRFRQMSNHFKSCEEAQETVLFAASNQKIVSEIREMAIIEPEGRASAAQMLVKCYDGIGLSTPRVRVPALPGTLPSTITAATAAAVAPSYYAPRTA